MNAYQRRQHRRHARTAPIPEGCYRQGYSGTTPYPDLMCTDGYMSDMDADGHDPSTARVPCMKCNTAEYEAWMLEQEEQDLPEGLWYNGKSKLVFRCRSCDNETLYEGEIADFDVNNSANVCGGSQYCLP